MSGLNFSDFKVVESSNTKPGGVITRTPLEYNFRYSRFLSKKEIKGVKEPHEDSFFELSKQKFEALGLQDHGMVQTVSPEGVSYFAVVDNDNAVLLKNTKKNEGGEKGRKFKSTIIEAALEKQGIISTKQVGEPQYLDLVLVPGSEGQMLGGKIKTYGIYEIVTAPTPSAKPVKAETEVANAPAENAAPVATEPEAETAPEAETSEPAAEPVAQAAAPATEDDDF